jgi:hypothetical protein
MRNILRRWKNGTLLKLFLIFSLITMCAVGIDVDEFTPYLGEMVIINVCCDTDFRGNVTNITERSIILDENITLNKYSVSRIMRLE